MLKKLNLPHGDLMVRRDHESRVALEYYRGDLWSEYVAFDARGPQCFRVPTAEFLERFDRPLETPAERAALTFLRSLPSAHLPGDGVPNLLLEIFTMAHLQTNDLSTKSLAELTAHYNALGATVQAGPIKSFKSKPEALARIKKLEANLAEPTEKQKANGVTHAADTLSKASASTAKKAEKSAAKASASTAKKAEKAEKEKHAAAKKSAAKAKPAKKDGAPRGSGIGAFCMDLIKKGKDNEQVLAAVKAKFPEAKTGAASIAWYRNKMKDAT